MKRKEATALILIMTWSLFAFTHALFGQSSDSVISKPYQLTTNITATTKGISTFPNLTVGKPAAIFEVIAGRRLTFEPQLRFTLQGKPWIFIFWWRYKLVNGEKFSMGVGAHPAFAFSTITDTTGGVKKEHIRSDRYLAAEITPYVPLTKNIGLGLHYIYARGVEKDIIRNTHYIAFRTVFAGIRITDDLYCRFVPQVYYLNMDQRDGWYLNSSVVFSLKNFPLAVSALINQSLRTEIAAKDDLLWNISLIYTFHREFVAEL